jgi:hypothetical protein
LNAGNKKAAKDAFMRWLVNASVQLELPFYVHDACNDYSSHLVEQDTGGEKSTPMELNTQQHIQQQQAEIAHGLLNANHHYVMLHFDCKRSCA